MSKENSSEEKKDNENGGVEKKQDLTLKKDQEKQQEKPQGKKEKPSILVKITEVFLNNKALSLMFLVFIIAVGLFSWFSTPKQLNPEINLAQFQVIMNYPGATAHEVETLVTREMEEIISDLEGVDDISSISIDGGQAIVGVTFLSSVDEESAKVAMRSKLDEKLDIVQQRKLEPPIIQAISTELIPALTIALTSEELTQNEIRYLAVDIMNEMKKVEKIANLRVYGGHQNEMRITLDPGKMKTRSVSVIDIEAAIKASNIKVPIGLIRNGSQVTKIEVDGTLTEKEAAEQIFVAPGVKLRDVAKIETFQSERRDFVQLYKDETSKDAVFISFSKRIGEDQIAVVDDILGALSQELEKEKYQKLDTYQNENGQNRFYVAANDANFTQKEVQKVLNNLFMSILTVFLVLAIFLAFRSALNVAIAIPLTILLTLFINYLADMAISLITLFAFILALGLLVDAATVMVESAYRNIQEARGKKSKIRSVLEAARDNAAGLFLATLTSVVVFIPIGAISGVTGQFMFPMAFIVPVALLVSVFLALSLTPFFSSILIKVDNKKESDKPSFFDRLSNGYAKIVEFLLAKRSRQWFYIAFTVFCLFFAVYLAGFVKVGGLVAAPVEYFFTFVDLPENSDTKETQKVVNEVLKVIDEEENVKAVMVFTSAIPVEGIEYLSKGASSRIGPNQASLQITLTNPNERDKPNQTIVDELRMRLRQDEVIQELEDKGAKIRVFVDSGGINGLASVVQRIFGPDEKIREEVAKDVWEMFNEIDGLAHVNTTIDHGKPQVTYKIDHEKAITSGVTTANAVSALGAALGPYEISTFHPQNANEYAPLYLQFSYEDRDSAIDLTKIYLKNASGAMVPLDSVVEKIQTRNTPIRERLQGENLTQVYGEYDQRALADIAKDVSAKLETYQFPENGQLISRDAYGSYYKLSNGEKYSIKWGGEQDATIDMNFDLLKAFLAAFIVLYALLVLQFGSFTTPLVVMTTIPLGFIGIIPGFLILGALFGVKLDPPVMIGFIALMGIVVNNSIMILEYFEMNKAKGMNTQKALVEAGRLRLRPILLTTITTVLGVSFLLSDLSWRGMALAIIFGLTTSVAFTLFLIPVLYNLIHSRKDKKDVKREKLKTQPGAVD